MKIMNGRVAGTGPITGESPLRRLAKDYLSLALAYLVVPEHTHRNFALLTATLFIAFIACFIDYAAVEKYHLVDSLLYGQVKFSFIDGGYPEMFGYCLEIFCAILFARYAYSHRASQWFAWSAIFAIVFLDDAKGMHETAGDYLMRTFQLPNAYGELVGFAAIGAVFIALWALGMWASPKRGPAFRSYMLFSIYFGILILAGVGVDIVHDLLKHRFAISETIMVIAEDGSELLMQCVLAVSALGLWFRDKLRSTS